MSDESKQEGTEYNMNDQEVEFWKAKAKKWEFMFLEQKIINNEYKDLIDIYCKIEVIANNSRDREIANQMTKILNFFQNKEWCNQ